MTRFGEIPPLWQNFKTLRQCFESSVGVGQNFEPTLANLIYYLTNFDCSKWPNIKQLIWPSGHTEGDEQPSRPHTLLSYSVHEGKHFFDLAVSRLFLTLIYHGACTVVHLLLLKVSMGVLVQSLLRARVHARPAAKLGCGQTP